jgi:phosphatidate cytidylyltransferase
MLRERVLVALALLIVSVIFVFLGGWAFTIYLALILSISAWEYARIFQTGGYAPSRPLLTIGVALLVLSRAAFGLTISGGVLGLFTLAAMTVHLIAYERGAESAALDFVISLGGLLYLGWVGSYLLSLRQLPEGQWWLLLIVPIVAIGDSGAYFIGRAFGKHPLAPRLSPQKTWEGYLGGLASAVLGGFGLALLWHSFCPNIIPSLGLGFGALLGLLTPLGDLGESMLKRSFHVKDSGRLLPGHGGMFDRIDSWLWAGFLGYFLVLWFGS